MRSTLSVFVAFLVLLGLSAPAFVSGSRVADQTLAREHSLVEEGAGEEELAEEEDGEEEPAEEAAEEEAEEEEEEEVEEAEDAVEAEGGSGPKCCKCGGPVGRKKGRFFCSASGTCSACDKSKGLGGPEQAQKAAPVGLCASGKGKWFDKQKACKDALYGESSLVEEGAGEEEEEEDGEEEEEAAEEEDGEEEPAEEATPQVQVEEEAEEAEDAVESEDSSGPKCCKCGGPVGYKKDRFFCSASGTCSACDKSKGLGGPEKAQKAAPVGLCASGKGKWFDKQKACKEAF